MKMNFAVKGRYRILVKKQGKVINDTGWFHNLITNQGMNYLGTSSGYLSFCRVGSSNTTPAFTDVTLGSQVAFTNSVSTNDRIETSYRYAVTGRTYTFSTGSAAGNIAEVGIGSDPTGNTLFSRALILDSMGNPTTITVLPDEDLVIIYELWIKQPTGDFIATVSGRSVTIRACLVDTNNSNRGWASQVNIGGAPFTAQAFNNTHGVHSGSIASITSAPSGTTVYASSANISSESYVPDSYARVSLLRWLPAQAVGTWLSASWSVGATFWQAEFSPAITKTNIQSLTIKVRVTWSRDDGPTA